MRRLADTYEQAGHKQIVWLKFKVKHVGVEGATTLYPHESLSELDFDSIMCDYSDLYAEEAQDVPCTS